MKNQALKIVAATPSGQFGGSDARGQTRGCVGRTVLCLGANDTGVKDGGVCRKKKAKCSGNVTTIEDVMRALRVVW